MKDKQKQIENIIRTTKLQKVRVKSEENWEKRNFLAGKIHGLEIASKILGEK